MKCLKINFRLYIIFKVLPKHIIQNFCNAFQITFFRKDVWEKKKVKKKQNANVLIFHTTPVIQKLESTKFYTCYLTLIQLYLNLLILLFQHLDGSRRLVYQFG